MQNAGLKLQKEGENGQTLTLYSQDLDLATLTLKNIVRDREHVKIM